MNITEILSWASWAALLIIQAISFTFVSRARNSASLVRHVVAAVASNGVWFVSQMFIFSKQYDIMTGKYGPWQATGTAIFYTVFTVLGALVAHHVSLKTEKGKGAVGANKKFAQIPVEEWEYFHGLYEQAQKMKRNDYVAEGTVVLTK